MNLREIGEFGLIGRIAAKVKSHSGVALGIGDDAAATVPAPGTVTLTTADMLVEGIHFDLTLSDPYSLGRKSLAVNLSDVAAMGAIPRTFLLSLALPPTISVETIDRFCEGVLAMADEYGVALIGGDTCASPGGLVISITAMGEQVPAKVIRRSGARPGDIVCVSGTLGDSALGLELLRRGVREGLSVAKHLDPMPRVLEGRLLADAGIVTSMIDISDGFAADLGHILECSGVGARIESCAIPFSDDLMEECRRSKLDPLELAMGGGEDYELLFTVPPESVPTVETLFRDTGLRFSVVGSITAGSRLSVVAADGGECRLTRIGYNHFA